MKIHIFYGFFAIFCVFFTIFAILCAAGVWRIGLVESSSMSPALQKGDFVLFSPQAEYAIGDIVCYIDASRLTAHRITAISPEAITTKGDNGAVTNTLPANQILGKVVLNSSFLGGILAFFQHFWGIFVIFLVILFVFALTKKRDSLPQRGA